MSKLLHIQNQLYNRPLMITENGFQSIHNIVQRKINNNKLLDVGDMMPENSDDMMPTNDTDENPYDMYISDDGCAHIAIQGPIGKKLSMLERVCGACDVDVLREQIDMAATNPDVECICFHIDSPGGSVDGVPDLADHIAEVNKKTPCMALVDGLCCSAAYYLASGCGDIIAVGKTSYIGSVGVYTYFFDDSLKVQNEGYKPILIKSGEFKADMLSGMPISDDTKARLQNEVNYLYDMFAAHVLNNRSYINKKDLQGQTYYAEEALSKGFIDSIVGSMDEIFLK